VKINAESGSGPVIADGAPPTPPGMRVRTGRFEKLRSGESRDTQTVEMSDRQHAVQRQGAVVPPAVRVAGDAGRDVLAGAQTAQFSEDRSAASPLLQLRCPQPVARPLIQFAHGPGRLRQSEVRLPARHVIPQVRGDLFEAAAPSSTCQLPQPLAQLVQRCNGLRGRPCGVPSNRSLHTQCAMMPACR
jgi:hypothetical protein